MTVILALVLIVGVAGVSAETFTHLVWTSDEAKRNTIVHTAVHDATGQTWDYRLYESSRFLRSPSLCVSETGKFYATWIEGDFEDDQPDRIWYTESGPTGWITPRVLFEAPQIGVVRLESLGGDDFAILWHEVPTAPDAFGFVTNRLRYWEKRDGTFALVDVHEVYGSPRILGHPALLVYQGRVLAQWLQGAAVWSRDVTGILTGASQPREVLTTLPFSGDFVTGLDVVSRDDEIALIYSHHDGPSARIWMNRFDGSAWEGWRVFATMETDRLDDRLLRVALDRDGDDLAVGWFQQPGPGETLAFHVGTTTFRQPWSPRTLVTVENPRFVHILLGATFRTLDFVGSEVSPIRDPFPRVVLAGFQDSDVRGATGGTVRVAALASIPPGLMDDGLEVRWSGIPLGNLTSNETSPTRFYGGLLPVPPGLVGQYTLDIAAEAQPVFRPLTWPYLEVRP